MSTYYNERLIDSNTQDSTSNTNYQTKPSSNSSSISSTRIKTLYNESYGLPNGWNSFKDQYNRTYYVNFNSGVSQFANPLTNVINSEEHRDKSLPICAPHIDTCTPYYLWHLGATEPRSEQFWYEDELEQPLIPTETLATTILPQLPITKDNASDLTTKTLKNEFSSDYWQFESHKQYYSTRDIITEDQLQMLPNRNQSNGYEHSKGYLQSILWLIQTNITLSIVSILMYTNFIGGLWWFLHKFADIKIVSFMKYIGFTQFILFCIGYVAYFILFIFPTMCCCLPWVICNWNAGWSQLGLLLQYSVCCNCINISRYCNYLSIDIIKPMRYRMLNKSKKYTFNDTNTTQATTTKVVLDRIEQFYRDIPILAVVAESYHYPREDMHYDPTRNNANDYSHYEVSKANHGSITTSQQRRSSISTSTTSDYDQNQSQSHSVINFSGYNTSNEPILSHRTRRVIPLQRYRDISTPSTTLSTSLLSIQHNLYNVVQVKYRNRFEIHPTQTILLDNILKMYYYHNFIHDLHCDTHIEYSLGPSSTSLVDDDHADIIFLNDEEDESRSHGYDNGSKLFKYCFLSCGGFLFWIGLYFGLYFWLLSFWKSYMISYTHYNVKYLHLQPFEQQQQQYNNDQIAHIQTPNSTKFIKGGHLPPPPPSTPSVTGPQAPPAPQPPNFNNTNNNVVETTTTSPKDAIMNNTNDYTTGTFSKSSSTTSNPITPMKATSIQLKGNENEKRVRYVLLDQVLFHGQRAKTRGTRPKQHQLPHFD